MLLSAYDFVISYTAEKTNLADAPSRRPNYVSEWKTVTELLSAVYARLGILPPTLESKHYRYIKEMAPLYKTLRSQSFDNRAMD
jgi:hypothetical protein